VVSPMYNYLSGQWTMARVTAEYIQERVPKFITATECATILETPQTPGTLFSII